LIDGERRVVEIFTGVIVGAAHLTGDPHGTVTVTPLKRGETAAVRLVR
jgi:hypothetical protein